jgi:hypothetical protein
MLDKSASSVEVIKWIPGQSVEGTESKPAMAILAGLDS